MFAVEGTKCFKQAQLAHMAAFEEAGEGSLQRTAGDAGGR